MLQRSILIGGMLLALLSGCQDGDGADPRIALCDYYYDETLSTFFEAERHSEMDVHAARLRELASQVDDRDFSDAALVTAQIADNLAQDDEAAFEQFIFAPLDPECEAFSERYRN